jgi:hypothetical protein
MRSHGLGHCRRCFRAIRRVQFSSSEPGTRFIVATPVRDRGGSDSPQSTHPCPLLAPRSCRVSSPGTLLLGGSAPSMLAGCYIGPGKRFNSICRGVSIRASAPTMSLGLWTANPGSDQCRAATGEVAKKDDGYSHNTKDHSDATGHFEFATRYVPAGVGGASGDWYDALVLLTGGCGSSTVTRSLETTSS